MRVSLAAGIVGALMPGCGGGNVGVERVIIGLIVVIEGCGGEQSVGREGVDPVGDHKGVALGLRVAQAVGTVVAAEGLPVSQTGIVGNLEVVLAILRVEPELIF